MQRAWRDCGGKQQQRSTKRDPPPPPPPPPAHLEAALGVAARHVAHVGSHPHHVGGVQGGVHLVKNEEGGGLVAAGTKEQRSEGGREYMDACLSDRIILVQTQEGRGWQLRVGRRRAGPKGPRGEHVGASDQAPPRFGAAPHLSTPLVPLYPPTHPPVDGKQQGQRRHRLFSAAELLHVPEALRGGHGCCCWGGGQGRQGRG